MHIRNHTRTEALHSRQPLWIPALISSHPTCPRINQLICVRLFLRQAAVCTGGPKRQLTPQMFIVRLCGGGGGGGDCGCVILLMEARGTGFLPRSAGQIQSNRDDAKHSFPFETFCGTFLWPLNKMTGFYFISLSFRLVIYNSLSSLLLVPRVLE